MAYNNIILSANSSSPLIEGPASDDESGDEIIYPGSVCSIKLGDVLTVPTDNSIHTCGQVGGAISPMIIAIEDIDNGKTVNDRYFPGEIVPVRHLRPGDVFLGRLTATGAFDQGQRFRATGTVSGQFTNTTSWDSAMCFSHEAIEAGVAGRLVSFVAK